MALVHIATGHDGSAALTQIPCWGQRLCEVLCRRSLGHSWVPVGSLCITAHSASSAVCGAPHTAEFERELIRARTGEGRERATARGQHMGRPFKLTEHQRKEALIRREAGELLTDIARSYNVSHSTISRLTT